MLTNFIFSIFIKSCTNVSCQGVLSHSYGGVTVYEICIVYTCTGFMYQL
jgi:hypothetical protein